MSIRYSMGRKTIMGQLKILEAGSKNARCCHEPRNCFLVRKPAYVVLACGIRNEG